jgi:hypothetical protein
MAVQVVLPPLVVEDPAAKVALAAMGCMGNPVN